MPGRVVRGGAGWLRFGFISAAAALRACPRRPWLGVAVAKKVVAYLVDVRPHMAGVWLGLPRGLVTEFPGDRVSGRLPGRRACPPTVTTERSLSRCSQFLGEKSLKTGNISTVNATHSTRVNAVDASHLRTNPRLRPPGGYDPYDGEQMAGPVHR